MIQDAHIPRPGITRLPPEGAPFKRQITVFAAVLASALLFLSGPNQSRAEMGSGPDGEEKAPFEGKLSSTLTGYFNLAGEINPPGLKLISGIDYRNAYRYSKEYDAVSGYWQAGAGIGLTPAYGQPSIDLEWMPWLPAVFKVQISGYYFFGANGGLLSFPSATQPFGDSERRALEGTEEPGFGHRIRFQPTLRFKIGSLVIRNQTDLAWYRFPGRGPYVLELEYDTLLKKEDRLFANRTQLLYELARDGDRSTMAGPFYEVVHAEGPDLTSERAGILFYSEQGPKPGLFRTSRYFGQLGYYIADPNRSHGIFLLLGAGGDFGLK